MYAYFIRVRDLEKEKEINAKNRPDKESCAGNHGRPSEVSENRKEKSENIL